MKYNTRNPSLQRLSPSCGKWIGYQLKLLGVTQADVAKQAGKASPTVANVLSGRISSTSIYIALCNILGYQSFSDLLNAARRSAA